jgi:hypothetical protein
LENQPDVIKRGHLHAVNGRVTRIFETGLMTVLKTVANCSGVIHLVALELFIDPESCQDDSGVWMKKKHLQLVSLLLVLMMPVSAFAITLDQAAKQAARQNNAKVLSARTIQKGDSRVHEIKLLTKEGVVKTVRIPDNSGKKR